MATIKNIHDYSDIINRPYKKSKKYKHMSQKDRAAQFAPFAALTGHKQLIHETQRITEEKREIDENKQQILNQKLNYFIEKKEKVKQTRLISQVWPKKVGRMNRLPEREEI